MSYLLIGAAPLAGLPGEPVAILDGTDRPRFDNTTNTWSATLPDGRVGVVFEPHARTPSAEPSGSQDKD